MIIQRLERPVRGIVSTYELQAAARVDGLEQSAELEQMAVAAAIEAEDWAQIALRYQAVRVTIEAWPQGRLLPLPIGPVLDPDGLSVTVDGHELASVDVLTGQRPAIRIPVDRPAGVIVIEYVAGFGEDASEIPEDLRHAILDQATAFFDARGAFDPKTSSARSPQFTRIVGRYRGVRA